MKSEEKARPYFEKYMGNLTMKVDRLEDGKYADGRVEDSWLDYWVGWTQCALFATSEERANLRKRLKDMRELS